MIVYDTKSRLSDFYYPLKDLHFDPFPEGEPLQMFFVGIHFLEKITIFIADNQS